MFDYDEAYEEAVRLSTLILLEIHRQRPQEVRIELGSHYPRVWHRVEDNWQSAKPPLTPTLAPLLGMRLIVMAGGDETCTDGSGLIKAQIYGLSLTAAVAWHTDDAITIFHLVPAEGATSFQHPEDS